jgi:hypothetical protein
MDIYMLQRYFFVLARFNWLLSARIAALVTLPFPISLLLDLQAADANYPLRVWLWGLFLLWQIIRKSSLLHSSLHPDTTAGAIWPVSQSHIPPAGRIEDLRSPCP